MKNKIIGIMMILTIVVISGCGGGGSKSYDGEKTQIAQALSGFEAAVEGYQVDGMLENFDETSFQLTIQEGSIVTTDHPKTYQLLKQELDADNTNQTEWRKSHAEGGHGYRLDMIMGSYTYSNMSATGGFATQSFEIVESAESPLIAPMTTDTGTITWELAKITGEWKVVSMTIIFNPLTSSSSQVKMLGSASANGSGFGFGKGYLNLP